MDRFALQTRLGYVSPEEEVAILSAQLRSHPVDHLQPCASVMEILQLKRAVADVRISDEIKRYIVDLVGATRRATGVQLGASPRASLALMRMAQALAIFDDHAFVTPDHVQELAVDVVAHRLVLEPQAKFSGLTGRTVIEEILKKVAVPA
jgi:MoxR-like ATPase